MRSRGTTVTPPRSAKIDPCGGARDQDAKRRKRPAAPQHSTFRRVAVFIPLNSYDEPGGLATARSRPDSAEA
jgi:hypothetical protein